MDLLPVWDLMWIMMWMLRLDHTEVRGLKYTRVLIRPVP